MHLYFQPQFENTLVFSILWNSKQQMQLRIISTKYVYYKLKTKFKTSQKCKAIIHPSGNKLII